MPQVQSQCFVIHKVTNAAPGCHDEALTVTAHDVIHTDEQSILGPGRVFSDSDKNRMLAILSDDQDTGLELLEDRVLARNRQALIWYRPKGRATVTIESNQYTVPTPPMIFALSHGELYVHAFRGTKRPTTDTSLLACGFPNIQNENGHWCTGGNRLPVHPGQDHIEAVERMFFESPFTHWSRHTPNGADGVSLDRWFADLAKARSFPMKTLAAHQPFAPYATLGSLIRSLRS